MRSISSMSGPCRSMSSASGMTTPLGQPGARVAGIVASSVSSVSPPPTSISVGARRGRRVLQHTISATVAGARRHERGHTNVATSAASPQPSVGRVPEPEPELRIEEEPELRLEPGAPAVPAAADADAEEETTPQPVPSPRPEKQMTKEQVRERVRAELEKNVDRRDASVAWIDARFDRFDADRSGTVDESEWENLLRSMEPVLVAMTVQPPWGVEMETNHNSALAVTDVKEGSAADEAGLSPGMVLTSEYTPHSLPQLDFQGCLLRDCLCFQVSTARA